MPYFEIFDIEWIASLPVITLNTMNGILHCENSKTGDYNYFTVFEIGGSIWL